MKLKTILLIMVVLFAMGLFYYWYSGVYLKAKITLNDKFEGPVRPNDNETYFRETGITRPLIFMDKDKPLNIS